MEIIYARNVTTNKQTFVKGPANLQSPPKPIPVTRHQTIYNHGTNNLSDDDKNAYVVTAQIIRDIYRTCRTRLLPSTTLLPSTSTGT